MGHSPRRWLLAALLIPGFWLNLPAWSTSSGQVFAADVPATSSADAGSLAMTSVAGVLNAARLPETSEPVGRKSTTSAAKPAQPPAVNRTPPARETNPVTPTATESFRALHFTSGQSAAEVLATDLPTGTLLFSQGDCAAVKVFTRSPYTHVAVVVQEPGGCFVYDSMSGVGVRRLTLARYCTAECPNTLRVCKPVTRFTQSRCRKLQDHLEGELGREYAVAHHLTGNRCEGLHCAEYATDALCACSLLTAENPPKVSPASLRRGVLESGLYRETAEVQLVEPRPQPPADAGSCGRCWFNTKQCTKNFFQKIGRVVFCR